MEDIVVPIAIMTLLVGGPIAAWIVSRVLAHNEYMAMLRMGIVPPPDSKAARRAARAGWVPPNTWGSVPPPPAGSDPYAPYGGYLSYYAQRQLHKGIQVTLIGAAILIGLAFIGYHGGRGFEFGPWLLPGLIVTFVGVAQIINGVLSGARVGGGTPYPPGNGNFGPVAPPPAGDSPFADEPPYGWRPGNVPEIEKPARPPDQR